MVAVFSGTLTESVSSKLVYSYVTRIREKQTHERSRRVVHDEITYTLTTPDAVGHYTRSLDVIRLRASVDTSYQGIGPHEAPLFVKEVQLTRSASGDGVPHSGLVTTIETQLALNSVARIERRLTEIVPPPDAPQYIRDLDISNRSETTTVEAVDGSFDRVKKPAAGLGGFREHQYVDGEYTYDVDDPGFAFLSILNRPVIDAHALVGISYHRRSRGRTIGNPPYAESDGTARPSWLLDWLRSNDVTRYPVPGRYDTATTVIGTREAAPAVCDGAMSTSNVVPVNDERRSFDLGGHLFIEKTTRYYDGSTLVCLIRDQRVSEIDVITSAPLSDIETREVRVLQHRS